MIAVDSSVWIDHLNGRDNAHVVMLRRLIRGEVAGPILVGELVLFEVLSGLRTSLAVGRIREMFNAYLLVSMLDFGLVPRAVANYHALRRRGVALGTVDTIIGTYCIASGAALLTADQDFQAMVRHLGLRLAEI